MITCTSCSKTNQDHYRFCLGCGAELPRAAASRPNAPDLDDENTQIGTGAVVAAVRQGKAAAPAARAPASPPPAAAETALPPGMCPECQFVNPPTNRFCASCGYKLDAKKAAQVAAKTIAVEASGAVLIALDPDGNEIGRHELGRGETVIGRDTGGVFGSDNFLSPKHAVFSAKDGKVSVRDNGSLNGIFRKLLANQRAPLSPGQKFRIGQELLMFDALAARGPDDTGVVKMGTPLDGYVGRVSLVVGRKTRTPSAPVPAHGLNLGRERGDVLFAEDGYVSGIHCNVSCENGQTFVSDLGSSNGTFVQVVGEQPLANGDVLLMGQQLFRVAL